MREGGGVLDRGSCDPERSGGAAGCRRSFSLSGPSGGCGCSTLRRGWRWIPATRCTRVGEAVADINGGRPCSLVAEVGHPQIAFTSRCRAATFALTGTGWPTLHTGEQVGYAVALTELLPDSPVREWEMIVLGEAFPPGWTVYVAPGVAVDSSAYGTPIQQE